MSDNLIEGYTEQELLRCADHDIAEKTKESVVFDQAAEDRIPRFQISELQIAKELGEGGFCVVKEISKITLDDTTTSGSSEFFNYCDVDDDFVQGRRFMAKNFIRKGKNYHRYAIKRLKEGSKKDASTFIAGIQDLAIEAKFLSVIRHPNIIKMRAVGVGRPCDTRFFVVLDRLYDILTTRLSKWKSQQYNGVKKLLDRDGKKNQESLAKRLTVAYDLASALAYMHELNIVYRDIKPDNIGFDVRDDVKIFDFGLAREYKLAEKAEDGLYNMTRETGTPRYMAPEVALGEPYNESADTYSLGILLWHIMSTTKPFEKYDLEMMKEKVNIGGERPKLCNKWSSEIQSTLSRCWGDRAGRPTMIEVRTQLRDEINRLTDEEVHDIADASRRSGALLDDRSVNGTSGIDDNNNK